jgi:hypothetical protein
MTDLEKLLAIEEIKTVFAKRVRYMDTKQWDLYAAVHTKDAVSESYGGFPADKQPVADGQANKIVGVETIVKMIRNLMEHPVPMTSSHHAHTPEIAITSDSTASGIWAMEDHLWWQNGETEEWLHGYGHYEERYEKVDGKWLIAFRKLTRLRVDRTPGFYDRLYA